MKPLTTVTLTGVDEFTSVDALEALSDEFPFVEWGLLYRPSGNRFSHRHPSWDVAWRFGAHMMARRMRFALHLCGRAVDELLESRDDGWRPGLMSLALRADRLQLNLRSGPERAASVLRLAQVLADREFPVRLVLPWNRHTQPLWAALGQLCPDKPPIEALVDASGGRGKRRQAWPQGAQVPGRALGFAGGLGLQNLAEEVPRLEAAADGRPFWVDMESSLRDERDRFNLTHCRAILKVAQRLRSSESPA